MLLFALASPLVARPLDLAGVPCDFPWEHFTTGSNTTGILFEDRSPLGPPRFLTLGTAPASNFSVEVRFTLKNIAGPDLSPAVGLQLWEGLERFGKDRSKPGHFLVLYTASGHLEVRRWNGSHYAVVDRRTRFDLRPARPRTLRVEASKAGSLRVYLDGTIRMTVRPHPRIRVDRETPVRLAATPGAWAEFVSVDFSW